MVRLVDTDLERPQLTAAIDEALLRSRMEGHSGDTVHLYRRRPASVSIGYFQEAASVADLEACRRDGVPVVRRISGGGAIYTDERQLVYALTFHPVAPIRAREGFALVCGAISSALGRLGIEGAERQGINDVVVRGQKVSGSAQVIRKGTHLVHGTLLGDVDKAALARYLLPVGEKERSRGHSSPADRVTTLTDLMGEPPPMDVIKTVLAEELSLVVGGVIEPGRLNTWEIDEADRLEGARYSQDEWNLMR
ncbi:MAG: lipoate--protein ligase family protein [Thermoplasmata archaeon]|nr:MAG: lipoate--protein ligase family protein [Thermoplasmata archaeon]